MTVNLNPRLGPIVLGLFLTIYLLAGLFTEANLVAYKPLPDKLLDDFGFYQRALSAALRGQDPYQERMIGPAFLYPPPSLLMVEIFAHLEPFAVRAVIYLAANIGLMLFLTYGLARHYGYSCRQVWFWFPIALGFAPFLELLHVGQINMVTLFGIFLMFWAESSAPGAAGLGLGLAIVTKVTPAIFLGYLLVNKRFKTMAATLVTVGVLTLFSLLRYGPGPFVTYVDVFRDLLSTFPLDLHSQSLVSKIAVVSFQLQSAGEGEPAVLRPLAALFATVAADVQTAQRALTIYMASILLLSGLAAFIAKHREPFFIVVNLVMMLSPNIMWYHHYVFILLSYFVWMAWSRFNPPVVLWCLISLLVIQVDRFRLTTGLLIHVVGHLTILAILLWQFSQLYWARRPKPALAGQTG